jgi:hypothetical protein
MQTGKWMSYSDSSYFSDPKTYKTLFILSYGSKDMILASFKHFLKFLEKHKGRWSFSHQGRS